MLAQDHHKFIRLTKFYHFCTGAGDTQVFEVDKVLHWRTKVSLPRFCTGALRARNKGKPLLNMLDIFNKGLPLLLSLY